MNDSPIFDPFTIYGATPKPRAFVSPGSYVQGAGVLDHLGNYMAITGANRPALMISEGGKKRFGARLQKSLGAKDLDPYWVTFGGECSLEEIERVVADVAQAKPPVDVFVAVGAGKACDAAKAMAYRLNVPVVVVPTLASTDAPCSALSAIYSPQGQMSGVEYYPQNPALVMVDTQVVAEAPLRYLIAGMGDALATWYEARVCFNNPNARSAIGGSTTLAAQAIGELCAKTIYENADGAIEAVKQSTANAALDHVVEANTLLSGIGFESGGLAIAHAMATAFTAMTQVEQNCLHGEMVAIGLLTQLALEQDEQEEERVANFFAHIGLPVHLGHLGLNLTRDAELVTLVCEIAAAIPLAANEPFEVTASGLHTALMAIHERGLTRVETLGDEAFQALR